MTTNPERHEFVYVADPAGLADFVARGLPAIDGGLVALDIEEDRERHFRPSVALLQVTAEGVDWVVDPLLLPEGELEAAMESVCLTPERIVMHGCRNDVTGLKRDFGVGPMRIGDTQVAARFLGLDAFGLAPLLARYFGVQLDKAVRRSSWTNRPLTDAQLQYARADTQYLLGLWEILSEQVREAGWEDAVEEECAAMAELSAESVSTDPFGWRRLKGIKGLDDDAKRRAAAIWSWRDRVGEAIDSHPSRVLPPWALARLAELGRRAVRDGGRINGLGGHVPSAAREELTALIDDPGDVAITPPKPPRQRGPRIPRDVLDRRLSRLAEWRVSASSATGLEPGFLAPRTVLECIARAEISEPGDYAAIPLVRRWRSARFADEWFSLR